MILDLLRKNTTDNTLEMYLEVFS